MQFRHYLLQVIIVCCCCCCGVSVNAFSDTAGVANSYFLDKQKFIFEVLQRVEEPLLNKELIAGGCSLILDTSEYSLYNDDMNRYYSTYRAGRLLPRTVHFTPFLEAHQHEAMGLFYFLYHIMDWLSFSSNICWARLHVNPGMFVYTLTQVLMKREDYNGLVLPKIYEILPAHFYAEEYVHQAQKFDYGSWSLSQQAYNDRRIQFNADVHYLQPANIASLRNTSAWQKAMADVQFICASARAAEAVSGDLSQLIADNAWNAYWYYLNMGVTLAGDMDLVKVHDWWYWNLQQIVARYKLEEYAQTPNAAAKSKPKSLLSWTGEVFQALPTADEQLLAARFLQLNALVQQAINEESIRLPNGTWLTLKNNANWRIFLHAYFDFQIIKLFRLEPTLPRPTYLFNFETMLQAREFYKYADQLLHAQRQVKSHFQPYQTQHLLAPGIRIDSVAVSQLLTYYELVDNDSSNLLNNKHFYYDGIFLFRKSLQARQRRLQHQPFQLTFNITAAQPQALIVRSFLVNPCHAKHVECIYFQLDAFITILAEGHNLIERQSRDFFGTVLQHISYTELYQYNLLAMAKEFDFPLNISTPNCGFPNHLLLPQGHVNGLDMQLVFVATPYTDGLQIGNNFDCKYSRGITRFDDLPFGFPFDRAISAHSSSASWGAGGSTNFYRKDVKIFHTN